MFGKLFQKVKLRDLMQHIWGSKNKHGWCKIGQGPDKNSDHTQDMLAAFGPEDNDHGHRWSEMI